ncbi:MAG: rod-binding protein, partial [Desulfovibrio sp.]|nr:rod-binding protein [Desulfovibrio sp.]
MNSPFTVDMARSAQTDQMGQDVQSKLRGLKTSNLSPEAKEKKLREACQGFESIFIQKMWQEMRKTVQQTSFMHGREEQFWQDMYDQELAKKMTSAGGIGLADMMYEQLSSHLTSASKVTAGNMGLNHSFMPSQAPLLPNKQNPKETPLPPRAEPMYEEVGAVAEQEESTMQMPQPQAQTIGAGPKKEESVDPAIENALATMRANVEMNEATRRIQAMPLADVSYSEPHLRQQPVAGSFDMVKAARRQAGDQLGSRGVREPLFPQTETARIATEKANERRQARKRSRVSAEPQ